jgi:hypothetical protein
MEPSYVFEALNGIVWSCAAVWIVKLALVWRDELREILVMEIRKRRP